MGKYLDLELTAEQLFQLEKIKRESFFYTKEELQDALITAIELSYKYQNAFKSICKESL